MVWSRERRTHNTLSQDWGVASWFDNAGFFVWHHKNSEKLEVAGNACAIPVDKLKKFLDRPSLALDNIDFVKIPTGYRDLVQDVLENHTHFKKIKWEEVGLTEREFLAEELAVDTNKRMADYVVLIQALNHLASGTKVPFVLKTKDQVGTEIRSSSDEELAKMLSVIDLQEIESIYQEFQVASSQIRKRIGDGLVDAA